MFSHLSRQFMYYSYVWYKLLVRLGRQQLTARCDHLPLSRNDKAEMKVFILLLVVVITLAYRQDRVHAFASSSRTSYPSSSGLSTQEVAQQLIEENITPYDDETVAPIESEFHSLMATFLAYSQEDIQSMTSTCNRYLHYKSNRHQSLHKDEVDVDDNRQPRQRSNEGGIRYRALFTGVQSASMEPAVLRSFTVLFEDYLPIRIAGRRIYKHLKNVMEEVRLERQGEIERAREMCSGWDWKIKEDDKKEQHCMEYARCIWNTLMDEALLLDDALQQGDGDGKHIMEAGVIPFHQLRCLGLDEVLMQFDLLTDHDHEKLEYIIKQIMLEEVEGTTDPATQEPEKRQLSDAISFVEFMRLLYHLTLTSPSGSQIANDQESLTKLLQQIQQKAMSKRLQSNDVKKDTSILLAAKAINSGSINACKRRQKHSDQFDHYVSTFQVWEDKFVGGDDARLTKQPQRRLEILRGCFEGARNEKVVAALKIVYMGKRKELCLMEYVLPTFLVTY